MPERLTTVAATAAAQHLRPGDLAIDATVGNGRDTLALARAVAPTGRVIGFDIQQCALRAAAARLETAGLGGCVKLVDAGHERLAEHLPARWPGRVRVVMFNLGYLPGGDKRIITRADTTLAALDQARTALTPGGLLSLLVYRGHAGSSDESAAVDRWLRQSTAAFSLLTHKSPGPVLHLLTRSD